MWVIRSLATAWVVLSLSVCAIAPAGGDIIKFKRGSKKKCVVIEETEEWVIFLTSLGETKMPRTRIESIERESDEVNEALEKQWKQSKKRKPKKKSKEEPKPAEEKPEVRRTYDVMIKKRRIMLGARASGITDAQPVASFVIKDLGVVKGSRLFHVTVTSYKSTPGDISPPDFYVLSANAMRVDPRSLEGYDDLNARLGMRQEASGHVAFPTRAELKTMVVRSDIADFELDLETGDFIAERGAF